LKRGHRRARGLTHVVSAALPNPPTRALSQGDKTSLAAVPRVILVGFRRTCSTIASAPLYPAGGCLYPLPCAPEKSMLWKGTIVARTQVFRGGGASKAPYMRPPARG